MASDQLRVTTRYGIIENVPLIHWNEFQPYWPSVVQAMAEVITENKFPPYAGSKYHPDGIVISTKYWSSYGNEFFFYSNALKFLQLLKMKKEFTEPIRAFNRPYGIDWLDDRSIPSLGSRVYGFYSTLYPIFIEKYELSKPVLSVRYSKKKTTVT